MQYIESKDIPSIFLNVDQEKAFDRVSHDYLLDCLKFFGFGEKFCRWIKILYTNIHSKVLINGFTTPKIDIKRSVRQGCPIAPLLYICVIKTLLINIRKSKTIEGIKCPCSPGRHLLSAFADDTGFFLSNSYSVGRVLHKFDNFGKVSGSKVNKIKTEGMWLGRNKENVETPFGIKWVKSTKSLGIYFGHDNINSLNWVKSVDKFRKAIFANINRNSTIIGKAAFLNYIGYSKLWYKALALTIPEENCKKNDNTPINIKEELNYFTLGYLWGFTDTIGNNNRKKTKKAIIAKDTLHLPKDQGGLGLIDYNLKMSAFRIILVYKYFEPNSHPWKNIVRYWFCSSLRHISNKVWNNNHPHVESIEAIPSFFKECISDFKKYYVAHGRGINEKISTKIIYNNLIKDKKHVPSSIIKFPEIYYLKLFNTLHNSKFLDPYLREFLYKFYHCALYFKKYKLTRDDMLNFHGQRCTLCKEDFETPLHLFTGCKYGKQMREFRDRLISNLNSTPLNLNNNNLVYGKFETINSNGGF